jgi:hypothetical protein
MTKQYYGVFDRQAGKLRNGFVYSSYDFAKKDVAQGIIEVTNDEEILELPEDDYDTIIDYHGFEIRPITKKIAEEIENKEAYFVNFSPEAFYYDKIDNEQDNSFNYQELIKSITARKSSDDPYEDAYLHRQKLKEQRK